MESTARALSWIRKELCNTAWIWTVFILTEAITWQKCKWRMLLKSGTTVFRKRSTKVTQTKQTAQAFCFLFLPPPLLPALFWQHLLKSPLTHFCFGICPIRGWSSKTILGALKYLKVQFVTVMIPPDQQWDCKLSFLKTGCNCCSALWKSQLNSFFKITNWF